MSGSQRVRRSPLVFGGCFVDRSLLDGEFDEFSLQPLHESAEHRTAAAKLLRSFDMQLVRDLPALHERIDVPVQLVWGREDPFFPVAAAESMVSSFPDAQLAIIDRSALFCHEERPAEVAEALLPALLG